MRSTAPPTSPSALREIVPNNFDAVRFIAAVVVIFSHCFPLLFGKNEGFEPLSNLTRGLLTFGRAAVDVFFAVSGFLIMMSWERSPSWHAYLRKRIARIVPGYVCITLFCLFVVAPAFVAPGHPWFSREIARRSLLAMARLGAVKVPGVFQQNPFPDEMDGPTWSISWEFLCYLGVLLFGVLGGRKHPRIALLIFLAPLGICALNLLAPVFGLHTRIPSGRLLSYFAAGVVFYLYRDRISTSPQAGLVAASGTAFCLVVPQTLDLLLPLFGVYFLFWCCFQPYVSLHNFARFGDFSYGIYLYGFPIQQMLVASFPNSFSPLGLFVTSTPIAILAGIISWHLVEKRFLEKRRAHRSTPARALGWNMSSRTPA